MSVKNFILLSWRQKRTINKTAHVHHNKIHSCMQAYVQHLCALQTECQSDVFGRDRGVFACENV